MSRRRVVHLLRRTTPRFLAREEYYTARCGVVSADRSRFSEWVTCKRCQLLMLADRADRGRS